MTLQRNLAEGITNPFDLLDTDANIVPVLPKSKLDAMIAEAISHEQVMRPPRQKTHSWFEGKGWWSGGLATAACLILLLTLFPQNTIHTVATKTTAAATSTVEVSNISDEINEISDMMFYDTLSGY